MREKYYRKQKILTETELKFYKMIKSIANKYELELFTQVSLYELVYTKYKRDFNKISRKTIDYVLTDKDTNIKVCIELDDYTHNKEERKKRDQFINELFYNVKIPLLRIPVLPCYIVERIEKLIKESL